MVSVPLQAFFFLQQGPADECLDLTKSSGAVSLASSALQVLRSVDYSFPRGENAHVKRGLYANAASIALAIPSYLFRVSLSGRFWEKIEEVLATQEMKNRQVKKTCRISHVAR
jgi:SynChlorMet cassette protein ScmC